MTSDMTIDDSLQQARLLVQRIEESLPTKVDAASLTLNSKLPFKALSVRETLIHRVSALASPALSLFEKGSLVAGIVLSRAVLETVAVTFALQREIDSFLSHKRVQAFDEFLMACLVGSRWPDASTQARNVLTFIDHVDKQFKGFRSTYDSLCEYAHPNWSGVLGAFGSIDQQTHVLHLGPTDRSTFITGVTSLAMVLGLFLDAYNGLVDSLERLNEYFESGADET